MINHDVSICIVLCRASLPDPSANSPARRRWTCTTGVSLGASTLRRYRWVSRRSYDSHNI